MEMASNSSGDITCGNLSAFGDICLQLACLFAEVPSDVLYRSNQETLRTYGLFILFFFFAAAGFCRPCTSINYVPILLSAIEERYTYTMYNQSKSRCKFMQIY